MLNRRFAKNMGLFDAYVAGMFQFRRSPNSGFDALVKASKKY